VFMVGKIGLHSVKTEDLKRELQRRESKPGIWVVVKYLRDDRENRYNEPKYIHLIELDGVQVEAQLVGNIYNKDLNDRQPTCSDEDPNWDSDWKNYEEYSIQYFLGKKVKIDSFDPLKISQIINN
jgi:hypothetical protein